MASGGPVIPGLGGQTGDQRVNEALFLWRARPRGGLTLWPGSRRGGRPAHADAAAVPHRARQGAGSAWQPAERAAFHLHGRERPLAIAALEDKIVQGAIVMVLNAIYEEDFLGFSYGFRPGRGPHDALDALTVGITRRKVNFILDWSAARCST